jgi:hypothetical protein
MWRGMARTSSSARLGRELRWLRWCGVRTGEILLALADLHHGYGASRPRRQHRAGTQLQQECGQQQKMETQQARQDEHHDDIDYVVDVRHHAEWEDNSQPHLEGVCQNSHRVGYADAGSGEGWYCEDGHGLKLLRRGLQHKPEEAHRADGGFLQWIIAAGIL